MGAILHLRNEHEGIKVILDILERICETLEIAGELDENHFRTVLKLLGAFVDRNHRPKEDKLLLPALIPAGIPGTGLVRVIMDEHELCRSCAVVMGDAFVGWEKRSEWPSDLARGMRSYLLTVRRHIDKENNFVFSLANAILAEEEQDELLKKFEKMTAESLGGGMQEEFYNSMEQLGRIYRKD